MAGEYKLEGRFNEQDIVDIFEKHQLTGYMVSEHEIWDDLTATEEVSIAQAMSADTMAVDSDDDYHSDDSEVVLVDLPQ